MCSRSSGPNLDVSFDQDGHFRALLHGGGLAGLSSCRLCSLALLKQLPGSRRHARPAVVLHPRRACSADAPRPLLTTAGEQRLDDTCP